MATLTVSKKFLGRLLRQARERAGAQPQDVVKLIGGDTTRVTRIENGQTAISAGDVKLLLEHFGIADTEIEYAMQLARDGRRRGRWDGHRRVHPNWFRFMVELEADANHQRWYSTDVICGLLQTEDYIRAIVSRSPRMTHDTDDRVRSRLERQSILFRDNAAEAEFILNESALRRIYGGNRVMHEQLNYLADICRKPNIQIQVLPFDAPSGGGFSFDFAMLRVGSPTENMAPLDYVYVEMYDDARYIDDASKVDSYGKLWAHLTASALGPEESRKFILHAAQDLE